MGIFGKLFDGGKSAGKKYDPSGSKGEYGRGYGKGSASSNPKKWEERTEAQRARSERKLDKWKG